MKTSRRLFMTKLAGIPLFSFAWPPRFGSEATEWLAEGYSLPPNDEVNFDTDYARHFRAGDTITCGGSGERMCVVAVGPTTLTVVRNIG